MSIQQEEPDDSPGRQPAADVAHDELDGAATAAPSSSVATSHPSQKRRGRLRRRIIWSLIGLAGLALLAAVWVVVTAFVARGQLNKVRAELSMLRSDVSRGDLVHARQLAVDLGRHAHRAHLLTSGPAWYLAAALPRGLSDPITATRGVASAADALGTTTVPRLVEVSRAVDPSTFSFKNHRIDLGPLIARTPLLDSAIASASAQIRNVSVLPHHTWSGAVNSAVTELNLSLTKLVKTLGSVDRAAHAAPTILGYTTPQRYFVAFQNEAEARGTGGLPGAFGILLIDHGAMKFTHFGSDNELTGVDSGVQLGAEYNKQWSAFEPTKQYLNSDVSPNFPDAAKIWAGMWHAKSGEHIDGALALDPTALSYFLAGTGPAKLPDGTLVTSSTVVALTQSTIYAQYPRDVPARKARILLIANAVNQHILGGGASMTSLFHAASRAVGERRVLMWQADPTVEATLSTAEVGGVIPATTAPFVGPVVINYGANKLDYYLDRTVSWQVSGCGSVRDVTATIRLTNNAPASGLSPYVTQRTDDPGYPTKPGDNSLMLYYIGTAGGHMTSAFVNSHAVSTLNTKALLMPNGTVAGHPTYSVLIELPRGEAQTVVLHLKEPVAATGRAGVPPPVILRQPLVRRPTFTNTTIETCN